MFKVRNMYAPVNFSNKIMSFERITKKAETPLFTTGWETSENPQARDMTVAAHVHNKPARHILGMVGGNEVSGITGNMVDLESDLRGITRVNTAAPWRQYQPPVNNTIYRSTPKGQVVIDTTPKHLPAVQAWGYPTVHAPEPIMQNVCMNPEKH
jgi:hypothetical protein